MGNQTCQQISSLNYKQTAQFCIQYKTEDFEKCNGSENVVEDIGEIDQCSPSTRFNIHFLKSTVTASDRKNLSILPNFEHDFPTKTCLLTILKMDRLAKTRLSLNQWIKSIASNSVKENSTIECDQQKTVKRLRALKNYGQFISYNKEDQPKKLMNIKITGYCFYKIREQSILPYYSIQQKIGEGSFGSVYKGKCLKTDQERAIKILKKKIMNQCDQKLLMEEIKILRKMDHINIIKLYDVFHYNNFFYVVTQYCKGGTLLQALENNEIKTEQDAAYLMKQIISAVSYMHQMKIAHRDLKLVNVVLVKKFRKVGEQTQKARIKIIDFGLAKSYEYQFRNKTRIVGTLQYMAPQIFDGFYSYHSDIWSCGIIMCLLLVGFNPLKKKNHKQTIKSIKQQSIDFNKPVWSKISIKAKQLLAQILNKKPEKRITSQQILQSQWIKQISNYPDEILKSHLVVRNFNNYNRGNNFICFIKNFLIYRELNQDIRQEMALIFQKIDTDSSGVIQKQQLIQLYSLVTGASDLQIQQIINKIDQNKSGRIDFQQFLICMTQNSLMHNQKCINKAFDYLDVDQTGFIQKAELNDCLEGCDEKQLVQILTQVDFNGDGKISREQFIQYLMKMSI